MTGMLHRAGYLRCEFDFDGEEDCLGCGRVPRAGAPMYWVSTSYEIVEGDYYCRRCSFHRASGRDYDARPFYRRTRPMHGAGWAYLHGMKDWELRSWRYPV